MSVPIGSLTRERRAEILGFYGEAFGWREMEGVSNAERLAMWIGPSSYINVREREESVELSYEHFGVSVRTPEAVQALWDRLTDLGAQPGPLNADATMPMFKFRHLLPMAIEVQYLPSR